MAYSGELAPIPQAKPRKERPAAVAETLIRAGREPFISIWNSTMAGEPNGKAGVLFLAENGKAPVTIKVTAEEGVRLHNLRLEIISQPTAEPGGN